MDNSTIALAIIAVIIVAALLDDNLGTIMMAVGLLYLAAELWRTKNQSSGFTPRPACHSHMVPERPATTPGQPAAAPERPAAAPERPAAILLPEQPAAMQYLGAIDFEPDPDSAQYGAYRDRSQCDRQCVPEGNPFVASRTFAPSGGPACFDDEANDDEYDADERNVYYARARNDPLRATIGIMNRRKDFDPFVREELEEEEDRPWWGRHEI